MAVSAPRSQHVSDPLLQPFLQPDFDPADYLNSTLPALALSSTPSRGRAVPLPELSSQLQTLLSQLNAQTARLSNTLTQLTDEIIRSGSRLAYEVEVLRSETSGLTDVFDNGLKKDIAVLVPSTEPVAEKSVAEDEESVAQPERAEGEKGEHHSTEPEFLQRLRTLTTVRERLDSVVKTFGSAMQWTVAPSELSLASSLISVSAPDSSNDSRSREEKGKEYAESLRTEVNDLLSTGLEGLEAANVRVGELRALAEVWKGTAEEKARYRLVDALQKLVDDKQKALGRNVGDAGRKPPAHPTKAADSRYGISDSTRVTAEGGSGYGFLQNLRNFKNEMYQD